MYFIIIIHRYTINKIRATVNLLIEGDIENIVLMMKNNINTIFLKNNTEKRLFIISNIRGVFQFLFSKLRCIIKFFIKFCINILEKWIQSFFYIDVKF